MKLINIIALLLVFYGLHGYANDQTSITSIDSLSYAQFTAGDWDGLIETAELAKRNNIDFKWLQQRVGYAYFIKKQFYKSMLHYEKALDYDPADEISRLYLYYNGQNTGRTAFARFHASRLSESNLKQIGEKRLRIADAIDLEYSFKMPDNPDIHQAHYMRLGLNSQIGYKLSLYQSFSTFNQNTDTTQTWQNEYFVLLGWNPTAKTNISIGYHSVGSKVIYGSDSFYYPGNIFYGKITQQLNRFDLALSGASFDNDWLGSKQLGIHLGINSAGRNNINLTTSYYRIIETGLNYSTGQNYSYGRNVIKQTAGIMLFNRLWTEAYVNLGNLNQFIDNNGLYFYNSPDPTIFRSGISGFWYIIKPLTIYLNYNYDTKELLTTDMTYNQHSITGGLIWKI